jgi:hypothetical protein
MVSNNEYAMHVRIPGDTLKAVERVCKDGNLTKQDFILNCIEGTLADLDMLAAMGLPVRRLLKIKKALTKMGFMEEEDSEGNITGNLAEDLAK